MAKTALITGITGQDGPYLAELLLEKGVEVHGMVHRTASEIAAAADARLILHDGNLVDSDGLQRLIETVKPDEIYNLGAQSEVRASFDEPLYTADVTGLGALRLLEAIRTVGAERTVRFYQASSSEMFGNAAKTSLTETAPFKPLSPYACAKVFAHLQAQQYRLAYGMHISCGILFNHDSPRRGGMFVTRKVTRGLARILAGKDDKLTMGNLDAKRDWGYAKDYVEAMWLMVQQDVPDDYVIATGETHSIRELLDEAFGAVGRDWHDFVEIDSQFFRPAEIDVLSGDATKAREKLGWSPKVGFEELVRIMLTHDLRAAGLEPGKFGL